MVMTERKWSFRGSSPKWEQPSARIGTQRHLGHKNTRTHAQKRLWSSEFFLLSMLSKILNVYGDRGETAIAPM